MKFTQRAFSRLLVVTATMAATTLAQAYFVRPYITYGVGEFIDGYEADGATARSENFTSTSSMVDLRQGTFRNRVEVTGPGSSRSSSGVFGDRLTFSNAQGTSLDFSVSLEGHFSGPEVNPNLNSTFFYGYATSLYVFNSTAGATYRNFDTLSGALVSKNVFKVLPSPIDDILDVGVDESLSGSFTAASSRVTVDVFASVSVFISPNGNPGTWVADFENTGRFGIDTAPGVSFTSESGVFLGSGLTPPVPEPSTYAMLAMGLLGIGFAARRRSRSPG